VDARYAGASSEGVEVMQWSKVSGKDVFVLYLEQQLAAAGCVIVCQQLPVQQYR
jgi:hypothetical protein